MGSSKRAASQLVRVLSISSKPNCPLTLLPTIQAAIHSPTSSSSSSRSDSIATFKHSTRHCQCPFTTHSPRRYQDIHAASSSAIESEADLGRHFYLNKVLEQWAAKPATRMTLRQLIFFGKTLGRDREKILKSANYVRQEIPVRIAHRIRDLQALPFVVMTNQHLEDVYNKYWAAFETLRKLPHIKTMDDNEKFCSILKGLLDDHLTIIPSLTIGIVESSHHLPPQQLDKFMERMLRSRISRRVLAEQHIALSEALDDPFHFFNEPVANHNQNLDEAEKDDDVGDHVGIIYTRLSVASVVRKGIRLLTKMFQEVEGLAADRIPQIQVDGDLKARFAYIPEHLEYIVFELLKNAIRSTIRKHSGQQDPGVVRVTIVEGPPDDDLIIRISDSGGGLPDILSQLTSPSSLTPASPSSSPFASFPETQYPIPFPDTGHIGGYPPSSRPNMYDRFGPHGFHNHPHPASSPPHSPYATSNYYPDPWVSMNQHPSHDWAHFGSGTEGGIGSTANTVAASYPYPSTLPKSTMYSHDDPLVDALCSFSNVRRRLELEEEASRQAPKTTASLSSPTSSVVPATSPSQPDTDPALLQSEAGLGTRDRFDALRTVRKFKGTVTEQVAAARSDSTLPITITISSSSSSSSLSETLTEKTHSSLLPKLTAMEGTGPSILHTVQVETGLGLPMAKVYCDFFGGSLSFQSLDGHSTDVYIRLPKLGTKKETIEEIVL